MNPLLIKWEAFLEEDKMSEMSVNQLIKLIIGAVVIIAVLIGAYFIFKDKIFGFFDTISINDSLPKLFLGICK